MNYRPVSRSFVEGLIQIAQRMEDNNWRQEVLPPEEMAVVLMQKASQLKTEINDLFHHKPDQAGEAHYKMTSLINLLSQMSRLLKQYGYETVNGEVFNNFPEAPESIQKLTELYQSLYAYLEAVDVGRWLEKHHQSADSNR